MKKIVAVVLIAILVLSAFCLFRDLIIKSVISSVTSNITGAPVHIGGFSLSVIKQSVKITNFKMYNPKGFPQEILVDIPKLGVSCNLSALIKGKLHLKLLDFDLKELVLTKNKEGKLNVDSLKVVEAGKEPKKEKAKKPAKQMAMQIDVVNLNIGRVINKDYSVGEQPVIKVFDINIKKTYKDITSVQQLAALIIAEPLKAAGIQGLQVYAATLLTGVAALPVAAVFTLAGKDYAEQDFNVSWQEAYAAGLRAIKNAGTLKNEDSVGGVINADVGGSQVTLKLKKIDEGKTRITVSARKFMLPQPEVAAGVMYKITEELK
ncbi:MAG: hypothetical protein NTW64_04395 [Candidatus Omnitrophica bacterium]|nr:hypothetical protein [Candidatus Omnitrophota bacterium]